MNIILWKGKVKGQRPENKCEHEYTLVPNIQLRPPEVANMKLGQEKLWRANCIH